MKYASHIKGETLIHNGDTFTYTGKWYREGGLTWFEIKSSNKLLYVNQPPRR